MATIAWFNHRQTLASLVSDMQPFIKEREAPYIAADRIQGHCSACDHATDFVVNRALGERLNLREGLSCARCQLTTRQRLIMLAIDQAIQSRSTTAPPRGALLEQTTRLYRIAHAKWPWLIGSEYLGDHRTPGDHYWWSARGLRWYRVRHESITSLSYPDNHLDLLVHSDVLEHVYDTKAALRESARVLKRGGQMVFTVPFSPTLDRSILRGKPGADGRGIQHIEAPEYHGDGVRQGGIYTFHNFGWDLVDTLVESGFSRAEVGYCFAPEAGFPSAHPGSDSSWHVLPYLLRATK